MLAQKIFDSPAYVLVPYLRPVFHELSRYVMIKDLTVCLTAPVQVPVTSKMHSCIM